MLLGLAACKQEEKSSQPPVDVVVPEQPAPQPETAPAEAPPAASTDTQPEDAASADEAADADQPKVVGSIGRAFFNAIVDPDSSPAAAPDDQPTTPDDQPTTPDDQPATPDDPPAAPGDPPAAAEQPATDKPAQPADATGASVSQP